MNLIAFSITLFATSCLAATDDYSMTALDLSASPSPPSEEQNFPVDSLFDFSFKKSAYAVGCELADLNGLLVKSTDGKKIAMGVSVEELRKITHLKWNANLHLGFLFDMELLKEKLESVCKVIDFRKFRCVLSDCALIPDATVVTDVAILKWMVQTIKYRDDEVVLQVTENDDDEVFLQVVEIMPYDLKVICALKKFVFPRKLIGPFETESSTKSHSTSHTAIRLPL